MPGHSIEWTVLLREFIQNVEHPTPRAWLREVKGWSEEQLANGNTQEKIKGWARFRADHQQTINNEAMKKAREMEKRRKPELMKLKMQLVNKVASKINGSNVTLFEKDEDTGEMKPVTISHLHGKEIIELYRIIKTELGEPSNISQNYNENEGFDPEEEISDEELLNEQEALDDKVETPETSEALD